MHRTDDDYLFYILRQAKIASPNSDVVLIGSPQNSKYASDGIKHAMIQNYHQGASEFAKVYKHMSPCEYYYNLFCFQRWFVLRDYMRSHNLNECWTLDSDVMLYADLSSHEYKSFSNEFTWTTYILRSELEDLCAVTQNHFADPRLFEKLKQFTKETGNYIKETGMLAISDMVTQWLFLEKYLKRDRIHGVIGDSFFDNNLHFSFPGVELLDNKKRLFLLNGTLYCKKINSDQFYRVNTVHFTTEANKKYVQHFYSPNLSSKSKGGYHFDYKTCRWIAM
ncbi:hypothetical protein [Brevibacillus choshinensis]|nr:hypothetical protein [Brevibacillus choshinensis]